VDRVKITSAVACLTLAVFGLAASADSVPATPEAARAWYIDMMRQHDCTMTAHQIGDVVDSAFPYADERLREVQWMILDEGMAMVQEGLIEGISLNVVRYVGPNGC
jgi:hypothetical protein